MLRELVVENLGVIQRADLELGAGSNALTGETGAGKTLVVSALGLLLGARAERSLIRHGAAEARVEARFCLDADHPALASLRETELLGPDETEVVVTRSVVEGGGKARINGHIVTVSTLVALAPALVEIAGQHEHQRISSPKDQTMLLDHFVGSDATALRREVGAAVRAAARALREAEELESGERERQRELDVLRFEISEIAAVEVSEGERQTLVAEARRLEHAETIGAAAARARSHLDDEGGAAALARAAAGFVGEAVDRDPGLGPLAERLTSAALEMDDVALELARVTPTIDPVALAEVRDRIGAIDSLLRKYGDDEREILSYKERSENRATELEAAAGGAETARREAMLQQEHARELAGTLSELRREAAPRLATEIGRMLSSLAMDTSAFTVSVEETDLHEGGLDRVEMLLGLEGQPALPISKVASGGELSRLALALRLATGASSGFASTLVFDEVDAGVGGAAARSVGRCLAELATTGDVQVVVVTHLPQVAAFADTHLRVVRSTTAAGSSSAVVERLEAEARLEELSRMLAGLPESDRAREHAQELLDIAASA